MQPIHRLEARWFWQWDRLEIARGAGLSLAAIGFLFVLARIFASFPLPARAGLDILLTGILLFLIACCLDSCGGPHDKRRIRCRKCGSVRAMGEAMRNNWRCGKCKTAGRFDNLR